MRSGCSDTTASLSTHKCEDLTSVSVFFLSLACSLLVCCHENQLCLCRFLFSGSARQFLVQLLAVVVVGAYSVLVTWLIMKTLRAVGPVRVSAEEEARGLDEEEAYHLVQ